VMLSLPSLPQPSPRLTQAGLELSPQDLNPPAMDAVLASALLMPMLSLWPSLTPTDLHRALTDGAQLPTSGDKPFDGFIWYISEHLTVLH